MSNKIFSVGIENAETHSLKTPVRYRVYTNDARISPRGAECVLWNQVRTFGCLFHHSILLCVLDKPQKNFPYPEANELVTQSTRCYAHQQLMYSI